MQGDLEECSQDLCHVYRHAITTVANVSTEIDYEHRPYDHRTAILEIGGNNNTIAAAEFGQDVVEPLETEEFLGDVGLRRLRGLLEDFSPKVLRLCKGGKQQLPHQPVLEAGAAQLVCGGTFVLQQPLQNRTDWAVQAALSRLPQT